MITTDHISAKKHIVGVSLKTFLENGRVVEFRDVFELTDQKVNSMVTKTTLTMSGLKKYSIIVNIRVQH